MNGERNGARAAGRIGEIVAATREYDTFEQREEAFLQQVDGRLPRRWKGPAVFWADLTRILRRPPAPADRPLTWIPANPRDGLAFGTPWQVLAAAAADTGTRPADRAAERFGLTPLLHQPIRSLSGGETVLLSLARAHLAAGGSRGLVAASPYAWLDPGNRRHFSGVFARYRELGLPVRLLALTGEADDDPADFPDPASPLPFALRMAGATVSLAAPLNPVEPRRLQARFTDFRADLRSPCLIAGGNGQGKSLAAKVLAGALPAAGTARIDSPAGAGRPRLLMQDVLDQALLRSPAALRGEGRGPRPDQRVDRLLSAVRGRLPGPPSAGTPGSLLETKVLLAARRLRRRPAALILDEPDWGLSRPQALAFVPAVVDSAHRMGVPVLLVSHRPWWRSLAGSVVRASRGPRRAIGKDRAAFDVRLEMEERMPGAAGGRPSP